MFVLAVKRLRRHVAGGGLFDWIPRLLGHAGSFISVNKGVITNVADVVGNVANDGTTTLSAFREIVAAVKARYAAAVRTKMPAVPVPLEKLVKKGIIYHFLLISRFAFVLALIRERQDK